MANCKVNKRIRSEGREIIANIVEKCDLEKNQKYLFVPLAKSTERAAMYAGVGHTTIKKIRNEHKRRMEKSPDRNPKSPEKKKKAFCRNVVFVDDLDKCVIRNTIQAFYINERKVPTIPKLLPIVREKINFPWGGKSFGRVLKRIGFSWRKCRSKHKMLIERASINTWRSKYLVQMKHYREEGREIFYIDETMVDNSLTFRKCWQSDDIIGNLSNLSSGNRLIWLHVGGSNGFLPNAHLVYNASCTTETNRGQLNGDIFEKWVIDKLIPSLPLNAVVVLDNAPYHCIQADRVPTPYALKRDMIAWLSEKGIDSKETMRKTTLYNLIHSLKPKEKTYRIDRILSSRGHTVVRLPPHMCDVNPIEHAWSKIRKIVRKNNVAGDLSLQRLLDVTNDAIQELTQEDWNGFSHQVESLEGQYWEKDGVVEDVIDEILMNFRSDSKSSDSESSSSSETDDDDDEEDYDSEYVHSKENKITMEVFGVEPVSVNGAQESQAKEEAVVPGSWKNEDPLCDIKVEPEWNEDEASVDQDSRTNETQEVTEPFDFVTVKSEF